MHIQVGRICVRRCVNNFAFMTTNIITWSSLIKYINHLVLLQRHWFSTLKTRMALSFPMPHQIYTIFVRFHQLITTFSRTSAHQWCCRLHRSFLIVTVLPSNQFYDPIHSVCFHLVNHRTSKQQIYVVTRLVMLNIYRWIISCLHPLIKCDAISHEYHHQQYIFYSCSHTIQALYQTHNTHLQLHRFHYFLHL